MAAGTALATLTGRWQSVAGVQQRTEPRAHILERFLAEIVPPEATPAHVHAFAYSLGQW